MPESRELAALLVLHRRLTASSRGLRRLVEGFGSAAAVFAGADRKHLARLGLNPAQCDAVLAPLSSPERRLTERGLRWLEEVGHSLILASDDIYPGNLREIPDAPFLLFVDGNPDLLQTEQLAIVGSRRITAAGRKIATRLAGDIAAAGITVTSGLALGVDAAAHSGALAAGGTTIAVLGCGCDVDYPPANRRLAASIREQGAVISELPLGTTATPWAFPRRNRIVTGLGFGTLVVEAALKSGSLISARLAAEQGREVFAVPGSIFSPQSRGCHQLIRDGAKLTESVDDILEERTGFTRQEPGRVERMLGALSAAQLALIAHLGAEPVSVDELTSLCGLPVTEILPLLTDLEVDGVVTSDACGYSLGTNWLDGA